MASWLDKVKRGTSVRLWIIQIATLLAGIGLMTSELSRREANAARFDVIPAIRVQKLGNFRGHFVHLLTVVGSKPILSTSEEELQISKVKSQVTFAASNDELVFPSVTVEKEGFQASYNYLVIVVSGNSDFQWQNADGSIPAGSLGNSFRHDVIRVIDRKSIDDFVRTQTSGSAEFSVSVIN